MSVLGVKIVVEKQRKDNEDSGASIFSVKKILPRGKGQHFLGIAGFFLYLRGLALGSITCRVVI